MQGLVNGGWGQVIVILLGILAGVLFNNVRLSDLRSHVDKRIDDLDRSLRGYIQSEIKRLEDLVQSESRRLGDRIDRIERPIFKP